MLDNVQAFAFYFQHAKIRIATRIMNPSRWCKKYRLFFQKIRAILDVRATPLFNNWYYFATKMTQLHC
jgi:hypothetical protein